MNYEVKLHVHFRKVGDEVVILDNATETYLGLNSAGSTIWNTIAAGGTQADAVDMLVTQYEVTREQAAADVQAFIGGLLARGLIGPGPS